MKTGATSGLTPRQLEVMELVAKGLTNPEICSVLGISTGTVKVHLAAILRALDVSNRTEAASAWAELQRPTFAHDADFAPTLLVLPFATYSTDPEDALLADGMTEDVISLLSRLPGLTVVGRSSATAFSEGDSEPDARRAHFELGVRYAVSGSVRRAGDRMRVSVGLALAETGAQLWAERWDRPGADLFEVQDEVVDGIAARLSSELVEAEASRANRANLERPANVTAWEFYQRAIVAFYHEGYTQENSERGLELVDAALELDPGYAYALAFRSTLLSNRVAHGWAKNPEQERGDALEAGRQALALAPDDPLVLQHWGSTLSVLDDPAKAIFPLQRSIEGNPSDAHAWAQLGLYFGRTRQADEAGAHFQRALRLSPRDPRRYLWHSYEGVTALVAGDWDGVIDRCRATVALRGDQAMAWAILATVLAYLDRKEDAREAGLRATELRPRFAFTAALNLIELHRPEKELRSWRAAQADAGLIDRESER